MDLISKLASLVSINFKTGNDDMEALLNRIWNAFQTVILPIVGGVVILIAIVKLIMAIVKYVSANSEGNAQEVERQKKSLIWSGIFVVLGIVLVSLLPILGAIITSFQSTSA